MKSKTGLLFSVFCFIMLSGLKPVSTVIPGLGIVATLDQDSLIYASGFRMLGESVGRMLSPALTEEKFQQNLIRIKAAKCKVLLCNIFIPGSIKIAGPTVDEDRVLGYADSVFSRAKKAGIFFYYFRERRRP